MTQLKTLKRQLRSEKRHAKLQYREKLKEAKENHARRLSSYYTEEGMQPPKNPPKRSLLEEIGNSATHGLGAAFAIVALVLMLVFSNTAADAVSAVIYGASMLTMFTVSSLYHAFRHGSAVKRLFRRFDYSCIYLLIGATFAPILLSYMGDTFGIVFFIVQWSVIALGISLVAVFGPSKLRFIHIPLYVLLGWSALMLLPRMIGGEFAMAMWILAGGVIYSIGIIPYAIKVKASHFIWHFFVLFGAVVQWIGIFTYIYLK